MFSEKLSQLFTDIRLGNDASEKRSHRILANEEGLITWATLVAVLLLIALIGIVFNVGRVTNDKLQSQNAADSVAYSSSLLHARAMNAVTATNHMMGELTALHTLHHSLGGKVLDERRRANTSSVIGLNLGITVTHAAAWIGYGIGAVIPACPFFFVGIPNPPASYGPALDIPRGEATVYDSKCLLKAKIIEQYVNYSRGTWEMIKGIGKTWSWWPPTVASGWRSIASGQRTRSQANSKIRSLVREYRFIIKLEDFALRTLPIKRSIPRITDGLWAYQRMVVQGTPLMVNQVASSTAQANGCVGEALGRPTARNIAISQTGFPVAGLPLVKDPCQTPQKTQLMRATYPWVQEWRWPILYAFGLVAFESRAMVFYEFHSDQYTLETSRQFVNQRGYRLYVIEELDATNGAQRDKGTETWRRREFSRKADQMFALVGIARKENPPSMSLNRFFLPRANETPIATVAQAMIYNANQTKTWRLQRADIVSRFLRRRPQPVQAWDTLAWTEGATEWKDGKPYFILPKTLNWMLGYAVVMDFIYPPDVPIPLLRDSGPPTPKVQLNWQAKLSPVTARNLSTRILMTQDEELKERMRKQVLPVTLAEQARLDFITH
jgi:hypothetical protein